MGYRQRTLCYNDQKSLVGITEANKYGAENLALKFPKRGKKKKVSD